MTRRNFIKVSLAGSGAMLAGTQGCSRSSSGAEPAVKRHPSDAKSVFLKQGT